MTIVVIAVLLFVVFSLGQALMAMSSGPDTSGKVVHALTRRIAMSVILFVALMAAWKFGWIEPHTR